MSQIEDGKGSGNRAQVNKENQLVVAAVVSSELEHESEENGQAYAWTSGDINIDATDTVLLIKNTSDTPLHIESLQVGGGTNTTSVVIHLPTTEVTPTGGTAVTGTNLNTASSNVADANARSDETDNTQGNKLYTVYLEADANVFVQTPGLILAKNKAIGVDVVNTTQQISATIVGHYAD